MTWREIESDIPGKLLKSWWMSGGISNQWLCCRPISLLAIHCWRFHHPFHFPKFSRGRRSLLVMPFYFLVGFWGFPSLGFFVANMRMRLNWWDCFIGGMAAGELWILLFTYIWEFEIIWAVQIVDLRWGKVFNGMFLYIYVFILVIHTQYVF